MIHDDARRSHIATIEDFWQNSRPVRSWSTIEPQLIVYGQMCTQNGIRTDKDDLGDTERGSFIHSTHSTTGETLDGA